MTPLLSLLTVSKDDPAGLARTLASTTSWRSLPEVESIAVTKGSSIGKAGYLGVREIQQPGSGLSDAFNTAAEAACGDWLWFLNGGDVPDPDLDPTWLLAHLRRTSAQVVAGAVFLEGEDRLLLPPGAGRLYPLLRCWIQHPASLARRDLVRASGGFPRDFRHAMDFALWSRAIGPDTRIDILNTCLARFAPGGLSTHPGHRRALRREDRAVLLAALPRNLGFAVGTGLAVLAETAKALLRPHRP